MKLLRRRRRCDKQELNVKFQGRVTLGISLHEREEKYNVEEKEKEIYIWKTKMADTFWKSSLISAIKVHNRVFGVANYESEV